MKLFALVFAVVSLGIFAPNLWADPLLTVNAGVAGGVLVETPIAGGETWVYTDDVATVYSPLGATNDLNVFTATFTDIAGLALLNVNDVCANVGLLHAPTPCSLAFSFTDTDLGVPILQSNVGLLGLLSLDLNVGTADIGVGPGIDIAGVDIGGGQAQFGFGNPPSSPSATPEPGSLSLLGTGLLGIAGVVRKKFFTA